jgi:hypothetical protein
MKLHGWSNDINKKKAWSNWNVDVVTVTYYYNIILLSLGNCKIVNSVYLQLLLPFSLYKPTQKVA